MKAGKLSKAAWKKLNKEEQKLFNQTFKSLKDQEAIVGEKLFPAHKWNTIRHNAAFTLAYDLRIERRAVA